MGYYWGDAAGRSAAWCGRGFGRAGAGAFPLIGGLIWLVIIVGIIVLTVALIRRGGHRAAVAGAPYGYGMPSGYVRSYEIARERYARGEISREEYEQMRKDLGPGS